MSREFPYSDKNSERRMLSYRCRQIKNTLGGRIFTDSVRVGGFLFREGQNTIDHVNEGEWVPFGDDELWGYREQYCWFKHTVKIPDSFKGKRVVYEITPFPDCGWDNSAQQFIFFVNGKQVQGGDENHTFFFLNECAEGGEEYEIALNAYCDDNEYRGSTKLKASLKTFDTEVFGLYYDLDTLLDAANTYNTDDMPRIEIVKEINEACNLLELCTPDYAEFIASVKAAREYLDKNVFGADSDVTISAIGHTHIDTAWRWRLRQTRDKAGRSFATVINLMKEYPEYKFMSPQAQLYDFVKQDYPALYENIRQAIKDGRWEAEGSMWVESDTNVISGESLARQFIFGKRFFREEFGKDNKIMWLPDVFGYSGAIPQVMKQADIDYFMTTKISWNEFNRFPYDTFTWEGIDGTEVLAHFEPSTDNPDNNNFNTTYNADIEPRMAIYSWKRYPNKDLNKNILCSFGHGDGGGGPTRDMLEKLRRMEKGIPGVPKVKQEFAREFFDRLNKEVSGSRRLPKWRGELYLEYHRGTLTAQARNKKYNRKSEFLLHDTETLCETAHLLNGEDYPAQAINEDWKLVLLNQFHDIIPGSSIYPVYEDSKEQYEKVLADGSVIKAAAESSIAANIGTKGDSLIVFNTFGQARTDVVFADVPFDGDVTVFDGDTPLPTQRTHDGKIVFLATDVPAKGYKVFSVKQGVYGDFGEVDADTESAENSFYFARFDKDMNLASLYFKESEREVSDGTPLNKLTAYEDRSHQYEAWDIKCYYDEKFWDVNDVQSAKVIEKGAVRTVIEVVRKFNLSLIKQYFVFYDHTARIDVKYDIDWKERNVALKADYPVDVNTGRATFDIQFGNLERSTTNNTLADYAQFEVCGHKWADLSDNGFGLAILNDCKYGWTVKDGHIRPTLLRSATSPNWAQDRERHTFTYAIYPHAGTVNNSQTVQEAYSLNLPLDAVFTETQEGKLPEKFSLVSADKDNIIIETVKKAEDSDALIVRMYETWNKKTETTLSFARNIKSVSVCNLLEEKDTPVDFIENEVKLSFRPFELKTLKVILE